MKSKELSMVLEITKSSAQQRVNEILATKEIHDPIWQDILELLFIRKINKSSVYWAIASLGSTLVGAVIGFLLK